MDDVALALAVGWAIGWVMGRQERRVTAFGSRLLDALARRPVRR